MTATFSLGGQQIAVLNGNSEVRFHDSMSLAVNCDSQAEVDRLWNRLTADGGEPGHCGWLKDKFGVSWQIVPTGLAEMLGSKDAAKAKRVLAAMMPMGKLDLAKLQKAHDGK
jgi:predicted 3-demethylubiquinone-9 3-methyltransferase (glyoxalase superfamily)